MVERFNGRIATKVLPINVANHADLEMLLRGFNQAYNQRRQRVLSGLSPASKVDERLKEKPRLRNQQRKSVMEQSIRDAVDEIMIYADDVSQPDS